MSVGCSDWLKLAVPTFRLHGLQKRFFLAKARKVRSSLQGTCIKLFYYCLLIRFLYCSQRILHQL